MSRPGFSETTVVSLAAGREADGPGRLLAVYGVFVALVCLYTMPLVLEAARDEFRKLERPINEPDFRWPPVKAA